MAPAGVRDDAARVTRRWLFADQLGPAHLDDDAQQVLLVESTAVFRRRRFHRQKAHLVLSAVRHRARELGERAVLLRTGTYGEALAELGQDVDVLQPTSFAADRFVRRHPRVVDVGTERSFATSREEFAAWAERRGRRRLLLEDFYREQRLRHDVLVEGRGGQRQPVGGRWNFDHDNREPPPRGVERLADAVDGLADPWWPSEDDVDAEVRDDLDRMERDGVLFSGRDGPRWAPATRAEALAALDRFLTDRLPFFGPHEDAVLHGDRSMAHSLLSPALNLGLLHPLEVVRAAEAEHREGRAPLASVEGFVRQVLGWREYVWGVYWWAGPDYRARNALEATEPVPDWMWDLDADAVDAACLSWSLASVRDTSWTHHIPRLMVLGNYALQRGLDPAELTAWFHTQFVDGYDWVMLANVVGMSQHADGGLMATKPYAAGGAYVNRMTDFCGGCRYDPKVRVGEDACPFTAGYWAFLHRNAERLRANPRMTRAVAGLERLKDRHEAVEQEVRRGTSAP